MKYQSKRGFCWRLLLVTASLLFAIPLLPILSDPHGPKAADIAASIIVAAVAYPFGILIIWCYLHTVYTIDNGILTIRSGPITKKIPISAITRIRRDVPAVAGLKLGLTFRMLKIHYQKKVVFISPSNESAFVEEVKSINSKVTLGQ